VSDVGAIPWALGRLTACRVVRGDCSEWDVEVDGRPARAVAYASLAAPLGPGDRVWLNTTAVELSLGTGGVHFIVARCDPAEPDSGNFPGREAGHILKLRYTPLQRRVLAAEEEASPHHAAVRDFRSLDGTPVVAAELHSQAAAIAIAARAVSPGLRIVLLQLDSAALPFDWSRLMARLKADGVLDAAITCGQAFGGDLEAVNVYSALAVAAAACRAELIVVTQGPGNVGTGTRLGFSGLALAEALHAAAALQGSAILAPRLSDGDARERHQGFSHHTRTLLELLHVPVRVVLPEGWPATGSSLGEGAIPEIPRSIVVREDPGPAMPALEPYAGLLTTMGRGIREDPLFFRAAVAAGCWAARAAEAGKELE
jgi:hypothetical protein